ncbi:hypothetical protein L6Q79_16215 [bacterium]|nr:hypothetical protein [bacterium]
MKPAEIGSSTARLFSLIGLSVMFLIIVGLSMMDGNFLKAFSETSKFVYKFLPNVIIGVIALLISSHYFGKICGIAIAHNLRLAEFYGIILAISTLFVSSFVTSWVELYNQIFETHFKLVNYLQSFVFTFVAGIVCWGLPFEIVLGCVYGVIVKKRILNNGDGEKSLS